ncbi:hypothetical protein MMC11_004894 [Xylographa trunciseda]|nr:hypothetical protein [Xylographa trunciseda]
MPIMEGVSGLYPDVVVIPDDDEEAAFKTGRQLNQDSRNLKRPFSHMTYNTSGSNQATEEQGSPFKSSKSSLGLRYSSHQPISPFSIPHSQQNFLARDSPVESPFRPQPLSTAIQNSKANMSARLANSDSEGHASSGFTSDVSSSYYQELQMLYSGRLRKEQTRAPVIDLDDDGVDYGDDNGNPNRSDLIFSFDHLNPAASDSVCPPGINVKDCMSDKDFARYMVDQQKPDRFRKARDLISPLPYMYIDPARPAVVVHDHNRLQLRAGVNVELENGDFMRITEIQRDPFSHDIFLQGRLFRRMKFMKGTIERKMNEVCMIQNINQSDSRSHNEQASEEVSVSYVIRRRGLKLTNQPYPQLSFREECSILEKESVITNERVLVCRWKYICIFLNQLALQKNVHCEKALVAIRADASDPKCQINDDNLRRNFRGDTIKGGASCAIETAELTQIQKEEFLKRRAFNDDRESFDRLETIDLERPGASFDSPLNVDLPFSGMSLGPVDGCTNRPRKISSNARRIQDLDFRGKLKDGEVSGETSTATNRSIIDLTPNAKDVAQCPKSQSGSMPMDSRVEFRLRQNRDYDNTPSMFQKSIWDVQRGYFVQRDPMVDSNPTPSSPTDSELTLSGDYESTVIDLEEEESKSMRGSIDRRVFTQTTMPLRGTRYSLSGKMDQRRSRPSNNLQRYTFGDGFCGCGGVSRGATIAGLCLKWAFDYELPMCSSYHQNFPAARIFCTAAFDFATMEDYNATVDVLHLSPPCQFFSPAHTTRGVNDDSNTASSFVILELLKKVKPRIVTLENTLGLEQRHPLYLHAVIQQFTSLGFSIRWKTIDLRDFGVPQSRRRLIIIAACPGEILPEFPEPTHSKTPQTTGLKPWVTINDSISDIPRNWANHDTSKANQTLRQPFDGNSQAKCMTTSGGANNYHPSGRRGYTIREYACLQTFPMEHMWDQQDPVTSLRKQIGNAVPPIFYAALARKIVQTLRKTDGLLDEIDLTTS